MTVKEQDLMDRVEESVAAAIRAAVDLRNFYQCRDRGTEAAELPPIINKLRETLTLLYNIQGVKA